MVVPSRQANKISIEIPYRFRIKSSVKLEDDKEVLNPLAIASMKGETGIRPLFKKEVSTKPYGYALTEEFDYVEGYQLIAKTTLQNLVKETVKYHRADMLDSSFPTMISHLPLLRVLAGWVPFSYNERVPPYGKGKAKFELHTRSPKSGLTLVYPLLIFHWKQTEYRGKQVKSPKWKPATLRLIGYAQAY